MKRAWIISPHGMSDVGGVERVMYYAARALAGSGFHVNLLDAEKLSRSAIGRMLLPLCRGILGPVVESAAYSLLLASCRQPGDIVIGNGFSAFLAASDLLFCHGSMRGFRFAVKGRRSSGWRPAELMEAVAGRRSRSMIAVSILAGKEWVRMYGVRKDRVHVVPNTVDASLFCPEPGGAQAQTGPLRVLFIGRLEIRKGIDRLLKLMHETRNEEITYIIAAPDDRESDCFKAEPAASLRIGVPLGDLPELYRSCDVMYLPSRYEGFEMVTLEALASGVPVVGCNVGGIANLVAEGFPGVYLADPQDYGSTVSLLRKAAREWSGQSRKLELNRRTKENYGLAKWSERFLEQVQHVR